MVIWPPLFHDAIQYSTVATYSRFVDSLGVQRSGVHVESRYRVFENVSGSRACRRRENISSQAWSQDHWEGYQGWTAAEWDAWRGVRRY